MNYTEALEYIHSINWTFCKPGLERIRALCEKLGNPQNKIRFIHVAGTNGKGSVCAMLSSILTAAGYKTGLYTSPYIKTFNERMAINGEPISDEELVELTEMIRPIADAMEDKPTEFELITAIAFAYFAKNCCDLVVLECGLGGRLDSTNIIDTPVLSLITGVAFDHTAILGNTIEAIAEEKAGIIKHGCPVLFGNNSHEHEALGVMRRVASKQNAPLAVTDESLLTNIRLSVDGTLFDFGEEKDYCLSLLGSYQPYNAATVLTAVRSLRFSGYEIPESAVRTGLKQVRWPARFERLSDDPVVIYDGGHNPQGIAAAKKSIETYFGDRKILLLTGLMGDKDYSAMVRSLAPLTEQVFTVTPDNPRSLPAEDLANVYRTAGASATAYATVQSAVDAAMREAKKRNIPLFILGSLYLYCEVYPCVEAFSSSN
ncbi:MAG: bifunctional folylpolyglutamate synthase/dihydrofolate synthase [Clostridia bacterium]|nr:bifunctional folylpolyglutamate synthase/dihydrofolate synthase [Clostridia bacterium]